VARAREQSGAPPPSDADAGVYRGRSVARRFVSPDGLVVLVGRSASDNDVLSLKLASPRDFWLHVAGDSGSHVVVRNPDDLARMPRETARFAAALAAGHSKARGGGQVAVHVARCADVGKQRGAPPGQVTLSHYTTVRVAPRRTPEET
jgi:predicted ribosome quality control (RQC) complex YloA/Tae2 family protein